MSFEIVILEYNISLLNTSNSAQEIGEIIKEANDVLGQVRGTQEAMEDAKMFKVIITLQSLSNQSLLCSLVNMVI